MKDNPLLDKAYCYHGIGGDIFRLQSILKHGILPQSELKYLNMPEKVPNGYGANGIDKVSVSISPMFCAETNELAYSEGITFVCKSHYFKYHYYCSRGVSVTGSHNDGMSYGISKNNITGIILPNKFYTKPIREYREFGCGYIMLPAVCKKFREFMLKECGYRANAKRYRDIFNRIETEAVEDPLLLIENMENTEKLGELVFEDLQRAVDKKLGKTDSTFADIVNYYIEGTKLKLYNREKLLRDVRIYKNREQTRKDSQIPIVFSKDRIIRRCVTGKNPITGRMIKFPPKSKGNDR